MQFVVNVTVEFETWFYEQDEALQDDIDIAVHLLEAKGPMLGRPYVDTLRGSRFSNMKELRVQSKGRPFRIAFAFGPNREAILLIGGSKEGTDERRFYRKLIAQADALFERYLANLRGVMMARSFNELRKIMTPERRAANAARAKEILAEMPLRQLRYALEQSQQSIAESLGTTQSEVSKLERRTDAYISTVRRYVEALGGHLDLIARFPDGDYRITQFSEVLDSVGSRRRGSRRRRETTAGSSRSRRR